MMMTVIVIEMVMIIASTIMIFLCHDNRFSYETKKQRDDENLARRPGWADGRTDGQTDTAAYRDAKTHLKKCEKLSQFF